MYIHITNLHLNTDESDILRLFRPLGDVKHLELIRDKRTNRSIGRAFIQMADEKEARNALLNLEGAFLNGKYIHLTEVTYDPTLSSHVFRPDLNE